MSGNHNANQKAQEQPVATSMDDSDLERLIAHLRTVFAELDTISIEHLLDYLTSLKNKVASE